MDPVTLTLLLGNAMLGIGAVASEVNRRQHHQAAAVAWLTWHERVSDTERSRTTQEQLEAELPPGWAWVSWAPTATAQPKRLIQISYENWTPEDTEAGETNDRGWISEDGIEFPDAFDYREALGELGLEGVDLTAAQQWRVWSHGAILGALKLLRNDYVEADEYSSTSGPFRPDGWYHVLYSEDLLTGVDGYRIYHLEGFTPEEQATVHSGLS